MSKKLLEEQAVRKFMKIAGLQPLTNSFLKESEEADLEEAKKDGKKLEEEVEDLEEAKEELEEGGGQMPFDEASRRMDERAPDDRVNEAKKMTDSVKGKGKKQGSQHFRALKEEDMPEEGADDVEAPEMDAAPEDEAAAGGLDVEGLVKELIRVITDKVPGAADVISVEEEDDETEVEMGGDEGAPGHEESEGEMGAEEGDEAELDETALQSVVAETVKRVKNRLMESKKPKTLTKEALAKKVAAKVAERLKKR